MKKVLLIAGLFLFVGSVQAYQNVIEVLPGRDFIQATSGIKSTGTIVGVSIGTTTAALVSSTANLSGFSLAETTIQNNSTDNLYCGHSSVITDTPSDGAETGFKIAPEQFFAFKVRKEIFIYCISDGTAASIAAVGRYGWK